MFPVHAISLMPLSHCNAPWHLWPLSCQTVASLAPSFTLQQAHTAHPSFHLTYMHTFFCGALVESSCHTHAHFSRLCLGGEPLCQASFPFAKCCQAGVHHHPPFLYMERYQNPETESHLSPSGSGTSFLGFSPPPHLEFSISLFLFPYKSP